jgi:hypothetical protein
MRDAFSKLFVDAFNGLSRADAICMPPSSYTPGSVTEISPECAKHMTPIYVSVASGIGRAHPSEVNADARRDRKRLIRSAPGRHSRAIASAPSFPLPFAAAGRNGRAHPSFLELPDRFRASEYFILKY